MNRTLFLAAALVIGAACSSDSDAPPETRTIPRAREDVAPRPAQPLAEGESFHPRLASYKPRTDPVPEALPAGALACPGCNLVIISLTNVRKDHLGFYGYSRATSPGIDRFFKDAIWFDRSWAPASWTLPVAASLFSGLQPVNHKVMNRYGEERLANEVVTLAETLAANGWRTGGFTGGGDYNHAFGTAQGFETWIDEGAPTRVGPRADGRRERSLFSYGKVGTILPFARTWLAERAAERFFLFVQGYDAHCPFEPSPPFDTRFDGDFKSSIAHDRCLWTFGPTRSEIRDGVRGWPVTTSLNARAMTTPTFLSEREIEHTIALYDGEIAEADASLAPLLDELEARGLLDNTIVIFMAEHGDLFGEHGRFMRGGPLSGTFYEPVLNFPLLIRHPKVKSARRVDGLFQSADFTPTLLELLGVPDPEAARRDGRSLVPEILDPRGPVNPLAFAGTRFTACNNVFFSGLSIVRGVRDRRFKLTEEEIYSTADGRLTQRGTRLVDLVADPGEEQDLTARQPEQAARLREALSRAWPSRLAIKPDECRAARPPKWFVPKPADGGAPAPFVPPQPTNPAPAAR